MKQNRLALFAALALLGTSAISFADGQNNVSQQIQLLNSQIQTQLQRIQASQQESITQLNKQIQTQLKQIESNFEAEMQKLNSQTEAQIKKIEASLQGEIKQLQQEMNKAK